jgi:hypothetical protein
MQSSPKVTHLAHYILFATLSSMLVGKLTRVPPFSLMICKSLFSFLYEHLNPHIRLNVQKEPTKIFFCSNVGFLKVLGLFLNINRIKNHFI